RGQRLRYPSVAPRKGNEEGPLWQPHQVIGVRLVARTENADALLEAGVGSAEFLGVLQEEMLRTSQCQTADHVKDFQLLSRRATVAVGNGRSPGDRPASTGSRVPSESPRRARGPSGSDAAIRYACSYRGIPASRSRRAPASCRQRSRIESPS